jgi:hypothetical protein
MPKSLIVQLEKAEDGSDDLILPIPDELIEELQWKIDDKLDLYCDTIGRLMIRKNPNVKSE